MIQTSKKASMRRLNEIKQMSTGDIRTKIKIFSDLLHLDEEAPVAFVESIMMHINKCLAKKEEMCLTDEVNFWVQQEAIEQRHLLEYGTFHEALIRCVEEKITPILTALLYEIDKCNNMMLLKGNTACSELWISLLGTAVNIDMDKVKILGKENDLFDSKFPFSMQIINMVNPTIKTHINKDCHEYNLPQVDNAVNALTIGKTIEDLDETFIMDYINDFILSQFTCVSETAYKVLILSLFVAARDIVKNVAKESKLDGKDPVNIAAVHVAFTIYEERFANAVSIFNLNPTIASEVLCKISNDDNEVVMDVLALRESLRCLTENLDNLTSQQTEFLWVSDVNKMRLIVKVMMHYNSIRTHRVKSKRVMDHSKLLWTKLRILQLYIDNVCPPGISSSQHERDSIIDLWNLVNNLDDNMKSVNSWDVIETFLNALFMNNVNGNNRRAECGICDKKREEAVAMPCHHIFCYNCIMEWLFQSRTCPVCQMNIPDDFQPILDEKDQLEIFEKRCLAFFVDIVVEFCFSSDASESFDDDVIKKIMNYALSSADIVRTKAFSPIQEYALDSQPIVRSFILQQLLKREASVECYIEECLHTNFQLADNDKDKWEMCKLFIHCYEDHLLSDLALLKDGSKPTMFHVNHVTSALENALNYFEETPIHDEISVPLLKNVVLARVGIAEASTLLAKIYLGDKSNADADLTRGCKKLFALVMKFIKKAKNTEGHMFLLRHIIRCHGSRELQYIISQSGYQWLALKMDKDDDMTSAVESDKYLIHGSVYQSIRDQLSQLIMEKASISEFQQLQQDFADRNKYDIYIRLAVLRECDNIDNKVLSSIEQAFNLQDCIASMNFISGHVSNAALLELLYHLMILLKRCDQQGLMGLYAAIINNPQVLQGCYLPTMPSDTFAEVAAARPDDRNTAWVLHRCPQGHAYVITECGRPSQSYNCPDCNSVIGGVNHQAAAGNAVITERDTTKKGYCLGSPMDRSDYAVPERRLSPLSVTIQRLLTHLSMLLGSLNGHQRAIRAMIVPRIRRDQVAAFLSAHIEQDFRILSEVLGGRSNEDINIIIHMFLKYVTEKRDRAVNIDQLTSKEGRDDYEMMFHEHFIVPFIHALARDLEKVRKVLIGDVRIGANPLMRKLYELDEVDIPDFNEIELMTCSQFWRYRQPITLEHFKLVVQEKVIVTQGNSMKILSSFLQKEKFFRLLKDLPAMIELQGILFSHFNYKMDRTTANEITISEALSGFSKDAQKKVKSLLQKLFSIWKEISGTLKLYNRVRTNPNNHPNKLNMKSQLSYVLCSRQGPGLCTMALIDFLAFTQNDFLQICYSSSGLQQKDQEISLLKLKENDIISYKPERDLLPLVYAHCDYSLEIGRGTKVEYNLAAIEKRLIENVFFGRARIIIQIEEFMYRDDVKSSKRFIKFKDAVQQTSIPHQEQQKMMAEFTEIADISNALRAVEIAIGMLTTTKGDPNMYYKKYLTEVLQMNADQYIASTKIQKTIRLTHLASMWTMLTVARAKKLHFNNKEPFDVEDKFSANIEEDVKPGLNNYLRRVDTRVLLSLLTEYIVSELQYRNENDADLPLTEALEIYEDSKGVHEGDRCEGIPDEIELKHIYSFWKLVALAE